MNRMVGVIFMRYVRFLLSIAALIVFSACSGTHSLSVGASLNNSSPVASHSAGDATSKGNSAATARPVADTTSASSANKLIALTFDDGPRPYVLFGRKESNRR